MRETAVSRNASNTLIARRLIIAARFQGSDKRIAGAWGQRFSEIFKEYKINVEAKGLTAVFRPKSWTIVENVTASFPAC